MSKTCDEQLQGSAQHDRCSHACVETTCQGISAPEYCSSVPVAHGRSNANTEYEVLGPWYSITEATLFMLNGGNS